MGRTGYYFINVVLHALNKSIMDGDTKRILLHAKKTLEYIKEKGMEKESYIVISVYESIKRKPVLDKDQLRQYLYYEIQVCIHYKEYQIAIKRMCECV